jgi:thiol-disulfide isomerase/thioredoxin
MPELKSWEESQELLKAGTKEKPTLIIHYWNECGHCQRKMPMWTKFEDKFKSKYNIGKLEASKNDGNIKAFPTYQGSAGTIKTLELAEEEDENKFKEQLDSGLLSSGGRRRRRRTGRFIRRGRKATHRTLRRHKTLR